MIKNKPINQNSLLSWVAMLLLSAFPILYTYVNSFDLNFGETAFLLILPLSVIYYKTLKVISLPRNYIYFWVYAAIALIITSGSFKITYLIPGGIAFTIFSLSIGVSVSLFNIDRLYACFKYLFYISVFIFVLQITHILPLQYQVVAILPISDHVAYTATDFSALMDLRSTTTRPSSLFLEPAYFAQFLSIFLTLELFYKSKDKLYSPLSLVCVIVLVLLQSGLGISALFVVYGIKILSYYNVFERSSTKHSKVGLVFVSIVIAVVISMLAATEMGQELLERINEFSEEGTSGFMRFVQGFMIFDALPVWNKIFGISMEEVASMHLPFFTYAPDGTVNLFTNGICTLLIKNGIIGLTMLVLVYVGMYRIGSTLSRVMIILLFFLALLEQVYLNTSMLICTAIATSCKKQII